MKAITRPLSLSLSTSDLHILQSALWNWEDSYRSSRQKAKAEKRDDDVRDYERKIAAIRNLKARTFRAEVAK